MDMRMMLPVLAGLALVVMLAIPVSRRRLMPAALAPGRLTPDAPREIATADALRALGRYAAASVMSWALCEAIAVLGLVAAFMSHDPKHFLGFAAASVASFVATAPPAPPTCAPSCAPPRPAHAPGSARHGCVLWWFHVARGAPRIDRRRRRCRRG